ncbi:hypothetical protein AVEN_27907-1 [Araneus ventricosus]|uniref:Uncharacterized protein n=1 Tax=Araneus ventricosus TaxID=182803 RepID=A0A4Y2HLW0_ARAVE|nr:hypothetical protein AVEN_27907-1 [Araneus ventricosus]
MLKDERPHIRELAARRIIKSRESSSNVNSVYVFLPPKLNFEAADYTEMIDWSSVTINSSPLFRDTFTAVFSSIVRGKIWNGTSFTSHVTHRPWNGVSS